MDFKPIQASHQALSGIQIFKELTADECTALARSCHAGIFSSNQPVVSGKDDTHDVYLVTNSKARATIISVSGKEVTFRNMGPGSIFGD